MESASTARSAAFVTAASVLLISKHLDNINFSAPRPLTVDAVFRQKPHSGPKPVTFRGLSFEFHSAVLEGEGFAGLDSSALDRVDNVVPEPSTRALVLIIPIFCAFVAEIQGTRE